MLKARDIMTTDLLTIQPECSIREAIELLLDRHISGLPVVDHAGRLVGILTEFALLAVAYDSHVKEETVASHMTTCVLTIEADAPIREAADLCLVHRVRRVPVMEEGRLVGLISRRDVLRAVHEGSRTAAAS